VPLTTALLLLALASSPTPGPVSLTAQIGQVKCPDRTVEVTITNPDATRSQTYSLSANQTLLRTELVEPGTTLLSKVVFDGDATVDITVSENGHTIATAHRTADCSSPSPTPSPSPPTPAPAPAPSRQAVPPPVRRTPPTRRLPFTGAGDVVTSHVLTGLGVIAGGGLLLFYALLWPRNGCGDWPCPIRRTR
jgi:hypothetical protein